jgi:16S rRNA pseudouridine516 synthase
MNQIDSHSLTLSIREGKYHQVKRMFSALGNNVQKLHRYKIGDIVLDHDLAEGEYRPLSKAEVASIP